MKAIINQHPYGKLSILCPDTAYKLVRAYRPPISDRATVAAVSEQQPNSIGASELIEIKHASIQILMTPLSFTSGQVVT